MSNLPANITALAITETGSLERNPAAVYIASLAKGSRPAMRGALNAIARLLGTPETLNDKGEEVTCLACNWAVLRFQHTAAIRTKLAETYSAATANKMLSALRRTLKEAWRLELMSADDYRRAVDVEPVTGSTLPAGRALTAGEIMALLDVCMNDPTPAGARDAAMLALLRSCGLRRAELCALKLDDYTPTDGLLVIHGKRNKDRTAYVTNGAADALSDWLIVRGDGAGPLFCPINKGGHVDIRRMFPEAVFYMLRKRSEEAGVKDLSPHDLRRTFVSDLLDAGADISTVQRLAGHASVNTTARYDRRGEEAKRHAVELLHVPYTRRKPEADGPKKSPPK